MKPYDILDALGEIDSDLLAACEDYTASRIARRKTLARCAAGVCAVLLLAVGIGTPLLRRTMTDNAVEPEAAAPSTAETAAENVEVTVQSSHAGTAPGDMASPVPPTEDAAEDVSESPMYSYSDLQDKIEVEVQQPSTVPTVDASPEDEIEYEIPAEDDGADIVVGEDDRYKDKTLSTESTAGKAELPMLSFSLGDSGFGFEGVLLYEDETPVNYNLLDRYGTPETLPVFKNLAFYDTSGLPVYLDDETLLRMGLDYADYFGYEVLSYDTKWDWDDEDIPGDLVRIDTTYAEIFVEGNGETTIRFKQEKELAANGSLAEDIDFGTAEKMLARLSDRKGLNEFRQIRVNRE